jgi:aryl-alcohol dehydrogenase-like predicted oxidoreductase
MRYRQLGSSDLQVSEICLGSWLTYGGGVGDQQAEACVAKAFELGINFIDTANVYSNGKSEIITGQALKNLKVPREEVVVATKVFGETGEGGINARGLSRHHIMDGVKASLKRLQLDYIDLYQVHGFDPATPIEETVRALDNLVQHGHVRYVGVSNWAAWQIMKALGISERHGLARFQSLQAYYTIAGRDLERDIIPAISSENIGLMVWSPLAGGLLSGKYDRDGKSDKDGRRASFDFPPVNKDRAFDCIDVMRDIGKKHDVSVAQIALAWLLHQPAVTSIIVGAKRLDQLDDNIAATEVKLDGDDLAALDQVSALPAEYPGWMLERQGEYRRKQLHGRD